MPRSEPYAGGSAGRRAGPGLLVVLLAGAGLALGVTLVPPAAPPAPEAERAAPQASVPAPLDGTLTRLAREAGEEELVPYASPEPPRAPAEAEETLELPRVELEDLAPAPRRAEAAKPWPKLKRIEGMSGGRLASGTPRLRPPEPAETCQGCANSTDARFDDGGRLGQTPASWNPAATDSPSYERPPAPAFSSDGSGGSAPADWANCPPGER